MAQRPCEQEWTREKAEGIRRLVEKLTGGACPCERGEVCPLLQRRKGEDVETASVGLSRG